MTHSDKVKQHQSVAWPYGHEWRGLNPAKKICCALRFWQGVQLGHCCRQCAVTLKKERRKHRLLLRQIQMNSDDKGNPQIPKIEVQRQPETKGRKSVAGSCGNLGLARMRKEFLDHLRLLAISREILHHFMPLTILHEVQDRCCVASPATVPHQALANFFDKIRYCVASSPNASYPRQVLVSCSGRCCPRGHELVFHFLPTFLTFTCLDPFIFVSFNVVYLIFGSFWSEEVIDFIFPSAEKRKNTAQPEWPHKRLKKAQVPSTTLSSPNCLVETAHSV